MNLASQLRKHWQHTSTYISEIKITISKKESSLLHPKITLYTCIHLTSLTEVISDRLNSNQKRKEITVFSTTPNRSLLVHHLRPISLLVMFKDTIVVSGKQTRHYVINLSTLKLAFVKTKNPLASCIHLIHNTTVFAIKLQKNYTMLLTCNIASSYNLLALVGLSLQPSSFF